MPADTWLSGEGPLCDRCLDDRVSPLMGLPKLPDVPDPVVIVGPDGRRHRMRYRVSRSPTGIVVGLREEGVAVGEGYEFGVVGDHVADVADLVAAVLAEAEAEIGRMYVEPASVGDGWQLAEEEVAGRLEWNPDGGPLRVVVDGRPMSWEELGRALDSYEGWRFRLLIDDRLVDVRSAPD